MSASQFTIYRASAGSGKTFILAVEYITALLSLPSPITFQHILAVTFTNKATAEMRDRILQQLYVLSTGLPEGEAYLHEIRKRLSDRDICLSDSVLRTRASQALSAILHDYSHFRVETIDSFFQYVMRCLAYELGLSSNLEVELNNDELIVRAVDRVIENLQHTSKVKGWVLKYVSDQIEKNEQWDVMRILKNFARCIFQEHFQNRTVEQHEKLLNEQSMQQFYDSIVEQVKNAKTTIISQANSLHTHLQEGELNYARISNGRLYEKSLQEMMLLQYDIEKKTLANAAADYRKLLKAADQKSDKYCLEAQQISDKIEQLLEAYQQYLSITMVQRNLNPLRLLGIIEKEAYAICRENNQMLLSQTPILLSKLVDKQDAPFVFEKMGTQLKHVMIDEFQDTSRLQWENFKILLLENQASEENNSSLVVGDVKQSIYRWRNGDWGILHHIDEEMKHLGPRLRPLTTNYRSHQNIIEFNNFFFPKAANQLDALQPNARFRLKDIYSDVAQTPKKDDAQGYVRIHMYAKSGILAPRDYNTRFVQDMIAQIRELMSRGVNLSDMVVLVRNRDMGTRLITSFYWMAPDITLVSDEAFLIQSSISVQFLTNALRVLADDKAKNNVPLFFLAKHYSKEVLHNPSPLTDFTEAECIELLPQEFFEKKDEWRNLPLYLLCERLYRMFNLSEIEGQEAYIYAFYDFIKESQRKIPYDIPSFLEAWDELIAQQPIPCGNISGLRIMTIHKSKGLQFHTVFLPHTEWDIEKNRTDELLWCNPKISPYDQIGILPVHMQKSLSNNFFAPWYNEEHLQKRVDALNTLYVAFTRPECNLYIWGITTGKMTDSSLSGDLLFETLEMEQISDDEYFYEYGSPMGKTKQVKEQQAHRMLPNPKEIQIENISYPPQISFMQSNDSIHFIQHVEEDLIDDSQNYVKQGKILHYVLSQMEHADDVERVLARCRQQGLLALDDSSEFILRKIQLGLSQFPIKEWFAKDKQVYNECGIVSLDAKTGLAVLKRPDRVVLTPKEVVVVDFKSGRQSEAHQQQVKSYMDLMHTMYPERTVKGFLWYLYLDRVVEV